MTTILEIQGEAARKVSILKLREKIAHAQKRIVEMNTPTTRGLSYGYYDTRLDITIPEDCSLADEIAEVEFQEKRDIADLQLSELRAKKAVARTASSLFDGV